MSRGISLVANPTQRITKEDATTSAMAMRRSLLLPNSNRSLCSPENSITNAAKKPALTTNNKLDGADFVMALLRKITRNAG